MMRGKHEVPPERQTMGGASILGVFSVFGYGFGRNSGVVFLT